MDGHGEKMTTGSRDGNYNNRGVIYTTKYKQKAEDKRGLGLCSVENLGPRGSKGKLLKLKRN